MKWFRWHRGTTENPTFALVARRASKPSDCGSGDRVHGTVSLTDVLAVWCVILEDATNDEHWGVCVKDAEFIATVLQWGAKEVNSVMLEMVRAGLLDEPTDNGCHVSKWEKYQYASDSDPTNAERQRRYYNAHKTKTKRKPNALAKRRHNDQIQIQNTDTERKKDPEETYVSSGADAPNGTGLFDARTDLFRSGLSELSRLTGKPEPACRSLVGKWLKQAKDDASEVHRAIRTAAKNRVAEPVAWIEKSLNRVNRDDPFYGAI